MRVYIYICISAYDNAVGRTILCCTVQPARYQSHQARLPRPRNVPFPFL